MYEQAMPGPWASDVRSATTFQELRTATLTAARRIGDADGATFVVLDGDNCFYVDEDAIGPLWRGQRFPITQCISGWAMLRDEVAEVPFPFEDDRIPHEAYRPTFIKSLVAVPMGEQRPVGAIGVYWSVSGHQPAETQLAQLRRLGVEAGRSISRLGLDQAPWAPNFSLPGGAVRPVAADVAVDVAS